VACRQRNMPRFTEHHSKTNAPKPKDSVNLATPDFSNQPWYGYRGQVINSTLSRRHRAIRGIAMCHPIG
ncbi:MAG: hypothetical protein ACK5YB_06330, partial [Burkholderiales bacterium]